MRQITADYIFPVSSPPIKNGYVLIDEDGTIKKVSKNKIEKCIRIERFKGIIIPGFVNTHCHLELSFAKDKIPEKTGINEFINKLEALKKEVSDEEKLKEIELADENLHEQGIVAVGDISNTDLTAKTKIESDIYYHTFIEVYGSNEEKANEIFEKAIELKTKFGKNSSIVAHSPYSLSSALFEKISDEEGIQSLHHLESESEIEYFKSGEGEIANRLKNWGIDFPKHIPSGKRPFESISNHYKNADSVLLVHNSFIENEDLEFINKNFKNVYYSICALSNDYIESRKPPLELIQNHSENICLGTDSFASHKTLSILDEIKYLKKEFKIEFEELLKWATLNGAKALGIDDKFGSIEVGKKPGLVLINNIDIDKYKLSDNSNSELISKKNSYFSINKLNNGKA